MRTVLFYFVTGVLGLNIVIAGAVRAAEPGMPARIPGLNDAATIVRDANNIAYIRAHDEHDAFFLQGWVHAEDRLFQMDVNRRLPSGTLAELLGLPALNSDVQLRTIGMRRAAERSLVALLPETRAALRAYADGVNAWVRSNPLPREYGALEITQFAPWTPTDSIVIGKLIAFSLSFELDLDPTMQYLSYVQAGLEAGFDGDALFHEDLVRSAPFDPAATVPDASIGVPLAAAPPRTARAREAMQAAGIRSETVGLARDYLTKVRQIPVFEGILDKDKRGGSNLWAVSSALSDTGNPLIANDPHLQLGTPSTFYPMGLEVIGGLKVFGECFPGAPGIVQGYNSSISWGTTNNLVDVTDTYQEQVVPDPTSPSGLSTVYQGRLEPIIPIPETFRKNQPGNGVLNDVVLVAPGDNIPPVTLIVPRRNHGPIISPISATGVALSVQYTGFSATRELDSIYRINKATNLEEFVAALQFFDFGSQNFVYADNKDNIAYFTTGELPIREDLQRGSLPLPGAPPWFIRNGLGGNEWLSVQNPQPDQALPYEILRFDEMPQIVNPRAGFLVNANNDPAGVTSQNDPLGQERRDGGIYYLAYAFNRGFRAGRIQERILDYLGSGNRRISFEQMQSIQADVKLRDAQVFVPYIVQAFGNAKREGAPAMLADLAANARIADAVERLSRWSFDTPTGIPEGYDDADSNGTLTDPPATEIADSVAATIFAVWRSELVKAIIDAQLAPFGLPVPLDSDALAALRNLLDNFAETHGVGASGVNFFNVPDLAAPDARDFLILSSAGNALDTLAGDAFRAAFANSTNVEDYRWGKLHRIVFAHPLGGPFSIPAAGGAFPPPLAGLPGIPTDGGFQTVDASSHIVRTGDDANGFMFNAGPVRRFVSERARHNVRSASIWPGGTSGALGSRWYFIFLPLWLTNEAILLHLDQRDLKGQETEVTRFVPGRNR